MSYNTMNNSNCNNTSILGNSIDVNIDSSCCDAEIRADIVVSASDSIRLWGMVKSCDGVPIENALLKLVKVICQNGDTQHQGIAHTVSDCQGFYQFDLCAEDKNSCYKILVGKANTGSEKILDTSDGNCHSCTDGYQYNPCKPYSSHTAPSVPCSTNCKPLCNNPCKSCNSNFR